VIFIGGGALLKRAVNFAVSSGFRVDSVFTAGDDLVHLCRYHHIPLGFVHDVNQEWSRVASRCSDGLLFSINNSQIFRGAPLAERSMKLFNIHNGLIPAYRGRPEVCLVYALLHGATEYGVTLHEIDAGLDSGATLDVLRFPVTPLDDFETIMLRALQACDEVFRNNLASVVAGRLRPLPRPIAGSRPYRLRDLEQLGRHRDSPNLQRATRFGVFQGMFPESWRVVEEQLRRM
jgi:methionyl-tRNA formyltransferase